eukprot:TRINITY_DN9978_c0_g1_i1.p1 TRINITY_DN9978_c0_g1~~TRINITY_DN9978_c0_g1_i1.p1  ORF type:complete len:251 (+),score=87.41 TRINITY_DN9978_c0_g1_i1:195-947(+)
MYTGPKELTGTFDLIHQYGLRPHYDLFCKKTLPASIAETCYLNNVVGDTEIRKGEGMELNQLLQETTKGPFVSGLRPFDLETLRQAFELRESGHIQLPEADKGLPTISGKIKYDKERDKKHKKHKDKDKEHKKHKHRHKDKDKEKDKKKDRSGSHENGDDRSRKHHKKKRKHDDTPEDGDHKHRHKDKDKEKDKKKDRSGSHENGDDRSRKHHKKKRKHDDTPEDGDHKHKKRKHKDSKGDEGGHMKNGN